MSNSKDYVNKLVSSGLRNAAGYNETAAFVDQFLSKTNCLYKSNQEEALEKALERAAVYSDPSSLRDLASQNLYWFLEVCAVAKTPEDRVLLREVFGDLSAPTENLVSASGRTPWMEWAVMSGSPDFIASAETMIFLGLCPSSEEDHEKDGIGVFFTYGKVGSDKNQFEKITREKIEFLQKNASAQFFHDAIENMEDRTSLSDQEKTVLSLLKKASIMSTLDLENKPSSSKKLKI